MKHMVSSTKTFLCCINLQSRTLLAPIYRQTALRRFADDPNEQLPSLHTSEGSNRQSWDKDKSSPGLPGTNEQIAALVNTAASICFKAELT